MTTAATSGMHAPDGQCFGACVVRFDGGPGPLGAPPGCREIIADAASACGSRPRATTGEALSPGRRDLDLFLLERGLEPKDAAYGSAAIEGSDGR